MNNNNNNRERALFVVTSFTSVPNQNVDYGVNGEESEELP